MHAPPEDGWRMRPRRRESTPRSKLTVRAASRLMIRGFTTGAVAQLGERLHGMQEVVGSTPIGSILHDGASC